VGICVVGWEENGGAKGRSARTSAEEGEELEFGKRKSDCI